MANYHGILQGGTGSFSVIKLGKAGSGQPAGTAFITSSDGGVDISNINMFTASYAKITELDVVTLNSITQTQENLNVSASLIVASDGAASTNEADGSGLYISGANASFTWDDGNSLMSLNKPLKSSAAITAGTSFIIGSADLNEADMEKLDGITNGTVAASKAVVVDSNKDASGFRNVTAEGSFIIGSADLNETDMEKIDGITDGTVAANKAVVVDSNKDASGFRAVSGSGALTMGSLAGTSLALQSGDITAAGSIAGATSITSTGLVSGSGGLVSQGATTLGSTLKVSGAATMNAVTATSYSGSSTLQAVGATTLGSTLGVSGAATMNAITATSYSGSSTLQAVGAATLGGTLNVTGAATFASYISASSYVSASSFSLGENSATIEYSDALDLSLGSTKYAALSTDYFSASVELQGPSVHTSGSVTAGTSFIIGSADLNEADMEKLDGITDGTVAANKAVVVDSNADASGFRNVTATGAFIIGSANLNETDMEKIDGITDGTVAANKAVVVDSNKDASGFRNITLAGLSGSSTLQAVGAATLGSTLTVSGAISGASTIQGGGFTGTSLALQSGGITAAGSIAGATSITSTGLVSGSGGLVSQGATTLGSTLKVSGAATMNAITATSVAGTTFSGSSNAEFVGTVKSTGNMASSGSVTAGTSFIIGSADINETDLEKIDGITNGAGAANKALVLDGNADIASGLRSLTGSGDVKFTNGHFDDLYVGANSFTIGSTELNESELSVLDSVTAGTVTASKVVVVDANKDIGSFRNVTLAGLSGSSTLQAVGAATLGSTLNVSGAITAGGAYSGSAAMLAMGATTLGSTLSVSGAVTAAGAYSGSAAILAMGAATLGSTLNVSGAAVFASTGEFGGHLTPGSDSTYNLGSTTKRWANIYTGDLHLKNERGNWTIFEEADHLRVRNNLTGKMYKMGLTPISEDE